MRGTQDPVLMEQIRLEQQRLNSFLARWQPRLADMRRNAVLYIRASSFCNKDILGEKFLQPVREADLAARFKMKIIDLKPEEEEMIDAMVSHLPEEFRPYLYYKNNMLRFIEDHEAIRNEIHRLYASVENFDTIEVDKHGNPKDPYWMDQIPKKIIIY